MLVIAEAKAGEVTEMPKHGSRTRVLGVTPTTIHPGLQPWAWAWALTQQHLLLSCSGPIYGVACR